MLTARNVRVTAGRALLLDGASVSIEPGKMTVVAGENGAGKSTLLKVLAGETVPAAGDVRLNGRPLDSMPLHRCARLRAVLSRR
jgi:iron complex transport system ATP-binding protein